MWDGKDRRHEERNESDDSHDLVVRIDTNLSNFMKRFEEHTKDDKESFDKIDARTSRLEKFFYGVVGAFFLFEVIMKLNGK